MGKYTCDACKRAFNKECDLNRHARSHTGEKNFSCPMCPKKFTRNDALNTHVKRHKGEKSHLCAYCTKAFVTIGDCKKHELTHTGEKRYRCRFCSRQFAQSSAAYNHERTQHSVMNAQVSTITHTQPLPYGNITCTTHTFTGIGAETTTVSRINYPEGSALVTVQKSHHGEVTTVTQSGQRTVTTFDTGQKSGLDILAEVATKALPIPDNDAEM